MKRVLNYAGSKWGMAKWLVKQMPEHEIYLEPFFGSGAVLFNKRAACIETVNDIDSNVTNLFKVMRERPIELANVIDLTPYAREEYLQCFDGLEHDVSELERARLFLIRCWFAHSGKTGTRTSWRHDINSGNAKALKEWNQLPDLVLNVSGRLKNVQIESMDALELIKKYNRADCLIYADPPYLRKTKTQGMYRYEMKKEQHINFLEIIKEHPGPVIISGYDSDLYDLYLIGWKKQRYKEKEVIWTNF